MDAQEAWEAKIEKLTSILPCSNSQCGMREYEVSTKIGSILSDFKASLREAIGKRKKFVEECVPIDAHYDARKNGGLYEIQKILELLDTIEPIKP